MHRKSVHRAVWLMLCLSLALPVLAQFGHPLTGTWSGEWWLTPNQTNRVLLEFSWDGKSLTGTLNPGPNAVPLQNLTLDPPAGGVEKAADPWILRFEADAKDETGKPVHYVVDGKMQNLGAPQRFITGTWTAGTQKGEFKVVRN
jgi:hypothetical protein